MAGEPQPLIVVTGANGFVGRYLCAEISRRGYRLGAAIRDVSRGAGIHGRISTVGPLSATTDWTSAIVGARAIVHLAARVHVMRETAHDPAKAFRCANVDATAALARAAAAQGVKRLVYVSSVKVNGEATYGDAFRADGRPFPQDLYGTSKHEAELELQRIAASTGLELTVIRPPLVYGPAVRGNFLRLLKLVRLGVPLPFGRVDNRRSMIYNGNLADALITCALHPQAAGKTYLVSDGEDLSTPELITRLAGELKRPARLWPLPARVLRAAGALTGKGGEVDRLIGSLVVDSSPIRDELGWRPPYTVSEGLAETARWFASAHP